MIFISFFSWFPGSAALANRARSFKEEENLPGNDAPAPSIPVFSEGRGNTITRRMSNGRGKLIFFAQKTTGSLDFSGKRCKL